LHEKKEPHIVGQNAMDNPLRDQQMGPFIRAKQTDLANLIVGGLLGQILDSSGSIVELLLRDMSSTAQKVRGPRP
jgi:hypothetical protein